MTTPTYDGPITRRRALTQLGVTAAIAALLVVAFVLPAESGVDPLGTGKLLGLTRLSQPATVAATGAHHSAEGPARVQTLTIEIPAEQAFEVKAKMTAGQMLTYSWAVDRGVVYSDLHGHGIVAGKEHETRYQEHQETQGAHGAIAAQFAGEHGWYWMNLNDHPVKITLTLNGYYQEVVQLPIKTIDG